MKYSFQLFFFCFCLLSIVSCRENVSTGTAGKRKTLSLENIDSAVKPGDNFYLFANGKWYDTATILPTESRAGARLEMDFVTKTNIKNILEQAMAADSPKGSIEQKVGDFFAAGMDTATIEKKGFDPIKPYLDQIDSIRDVAAIMRFAASQAVIGNSILIGQFVFADEKQSSVNILCFYQAGLGLPDRDYYFKSDDATKTVVASYQKYINRLFLLTGNDSATAVRNTAVVYALEKKMATSHRTNVELRDPQTNYNKIAVKDLNRKMPVLDWSNLLQGLQVKADSVNVGQPAYYENLNTFLKTIPIDTWKTYLRFHLIDNFAALLSRDFVEANFDYYQRTLNGQKMRKERWEDIYANIDVMLGEALGQLYVERYFPSESKRRITELVNNLQKAFKIRIDKLDWMSDSTKSIAQEKLRTFIKKVAYPDHWRDYSKVVITRDDYVQNTISSGKNAYAFQASKVGRPVDKTEWGMTPPTNNAYYNPTFNEIVFPAGILQYPMFDAGSDDAMNYGGIGLVIGHEMTHGFDDQGAQYDKEGNLKNWWNKDDYARFKSKGQQVISLYNGFVVLDSIHVNGRLTQGENTADMGGIAIAYEAFKMTREGQDTTRIDGFTPDQRFFLSFAQTWRKKLKDEALRQQVNTDPHSPGMYRVLGPLMNFTPFYTAFGVKKGDKMFVPDSARISIW